MDSDTSKKLDYKIVMEAVMIPFQNLPQNLYIRKPVHFVLYDHGKYRRATEEEEAIIAAGQANLIVSIDDKPLCKPIPLVTGLHGGLVYERAEQSDPMVTKCFACGGELEDIRAKLVCKQCGRINESCCEGGQCG